MMDRDTQKLIDALKKKREAEGFSIRKLSSVIGVSFSSLARIERGAGEPDNNSRIRILEWLGKDASESGLTFENVALAHFRASKNVDSKTIDCLLQVANCLKTKYGTFSEGKSASSSISQIYPESSAISLSKSEMETMAQNFRKDLNSKDTDALDALAIKIEGVQVFTIDQLQLGDKCAAHLQGEGSVSWSAMSVPLDENNDTWAIVRNDKHEIGRQRVTFLEECWHILLGHKLTKISKIANAYGRTYETNEEHDAFYLASASLLPEKIIQKFVNTKDDIAKIAEKYGTSIELIEYRIKRLGLWRHYKGRNVEIDSSTKRP